MILSKTAPAFQRDLTSLQTFASLPSVWVGEVAACMTAYIQDCDTDKAIGIVQIARRIIKIFTCGLEENAALRTALERAPLTDWVNFSEPPVDRETQRRLADMLYIVGSKTDVPMLEIGDQARYIGAALFERCVAEGLAFDINVADDNFMAVFLQYADDAAIAKLAAHFLETRADITTRILVHHNLPVWETIEAPLDKQKAYRALLKPYRERVLSGKMRSVLTSIPTTRDAAVDGIPYPEYTDLYFKMCDQPWPQIRAAQYALIETLNAAKVLHFTNNDGTDLTMNIDRFTFCNSVIARNIPGSEVFSAPKIDSTNGVILAKGRFAAKDDAGAIMENLTLRFKDGQLIEALAEKGQEQLDKTLSVDEGAKRIGEIGIGTNPYLKRHVTSILLSEKIGGSFHVALGDAYTMTDYMGDPVVVDNGNRSQLHWDITTMLIGKEGRIVADGIPIMVDGLFTDAALDVLNRGWAALPFADRPKAWQKIYPAK